MYVDEKQQIEERQELQQERSTKQKPGSGHTDWKAWGAGLGLTILLGLIAFLLALLPGLATVGSLTIALILGLAWRAIVGLPATLTGGVRFSAQKVLRYGIILTGVRLNFQLIAASGLQVLLLDVLLILFGLLVLPKLAHKLGLSRHLSFLLGVGQSICGASAVGAVSALLRGADEEETSLAVAICGLVGTIGVLLFTFAAPLLHLHGHIYGLLSGSTLHEIAQVVAAGPVGGVGAADMAMVVKLTRVMLLAPVALFLAFFLAFKEGKQDGASGSVNWKNIPIPWFVFGFLAVGAINSFGWLPKDVSNIVVQISVFLMVMAMAAMGLMVDLSVIRRTGLKALGIAVLSFFIFVGVSSCLLFVLHLAA
ncbi:putative sulfate exporter family transporter [Ktedonosporobacter rubrisoli]|uniref:Putative sulfate exporter family transporter n=1 Tax=Ktedonosporobacter rubrisoli TaxID=2509675 RepID=A0A4P6JIC7_KTERU|nr:putative sulfate exporter family transporter [Ktedonosporobacter rubrisoli]QBD74817.1 putative sulfate exporter family transporter [Ktedonosporobacter rubrisoli]